MTAPVTCNRCQLSEAENQVKLKMRLLEKVGKKGGVVKAFWNGKRWEITASMK